MATTIREFEDFAVDLTKRRGGLEEGIKGASPAFDSTSQEHQVLPAAEGHVEEATKNKSKSTEGKEWVLFPWVPCVDLQHGVSQCPIASAFNPGDVMKPRYSQTAVLQQRETSGLVPHPCPVGRSI